MNQQTPRRESLASIGQRRLHAVRTKGIYVLPNAFIVRAAYVPSV